MLVWDSMWYVQIIVLGAVWIKKSSFMAVKGLFELFKNGL